MEDDPDPASLEVKMGDPITASLGPMGRLIQRLHSFKPSDHCLPEGLSPDGIRLLKEGLEGLYGNLKDASEADMDPSLTPKWWIKEVRELGYDTEDFFDEVMHSGAGDGAVVHRNIGCTTIFQIGSKRKQHRLLAAENFSQLMARVHDAGERCQSFQLAPEIHVPELSLDLPALTALTTDVQVDNAGCSIVGVEESMRKLVNLMAFGDVDQKQLKVVPIFGSAGVGKTTFARTIYHQYGWQFQCRAFLRVSRNPDIRWLLTSILSQIKAPQTHAFSDVQDLIDSIMKHLQGQRYFIIVDDLWSASVWDIISRAFPYSNFCSRILTTTQIEDVALACSGYESEYIFKMGPLNDVDSRKLFFSNVFGSEGEGDCPKEFKIVADRFIRKCGGLPLSIVNIASLLPSNKANRAIKQWVKIESSLPSTLTTNSASQGMKDLLILIYNKLPLHLKTCLLYLSMYPESYTIRKDDLVKQWVGESFVGDIEHSCFDELIRRGMIQPVDTNYQGEVLSCTVNHMVLDFIRHRSAADNFIVAVNHFESILGLPDKVRRLSIQFGGAKSVKIPESVRMPHVRSLLYCGFSRFVPSIQDYGLLRVLVLHIWADQDQTSFDLTRIGELFRLRYLKIECNITVNLPGKIQGLRYLETLQVDGRLSAVPTDIGHLEKLRVLRLPSQANVRDLVGLTNLQDLHLTHSTGQPPVYLEDNMKFMGSILEKLSHLKSVILASAASYPVNAPRVNVSCHGLSNLSPTLANLERLELLPRGCIFPSLPKWFKTLGKLYSLKIAVRQLSNSDIDIIKVLPVLSSLSLYIQTAPAERIVFDKAGFSALKYFKLRCSAPLLKFEAGAMPCLRKLQLVFNAQEVQQHGAAPICIQHLAGLQEISAKFAGVGSAGVECALFPVSNDPKNPKINDQLVNWNFCADKDYIMATPDQAAMVIEEKGEIVEENTEAEDGNRQPDSGSAMIIEEQVVILEEDTNYEYKGQDGNRQPDSGSSTSWGFSPVLPQGRHGWKYWRKVLSTLPRAWRALQTTYEGRDDLLWWQHLVPCNTGELSMDDMQANHLLVDRCRVESSPILGTFVGIFDGHHGPKAARFTADHLFPYLQTEAVSSGQGVTAETIRKAFLHTEKSFITLVSRTWAAEPAIAAAGSCCLVGIMHQRTLFIANLGNSRALLGKVGLDGRIAPEQLSSEHDVCHKSVRQELMAQHPDDPHIVVLKHNVWRVKGIIQVSRSIGDAYLKHPRFNKEPLHRKFRIGAPFSRPILSADPSITSHTLQPSDRFVIFASDGLWEFLSNEKAIEIVHTHERTGIARTLINAALNEAARKHEMRYSFLRKIKSGVRRHLHDDITVVVLFIDYDQLGLATSEHYQEIQSVDTVRIGQANVVRGMKNGGNTCYFNAVLQSLLALDNLRARMLGPDALPGNLGQELQKLFMMTSDTNGARSVLMPDKLFLHMCSMYSGFRSGEMEDSNHMLGSLLDGLNSEDPTMIESLFRGECVKHVSSNECEHTSVTTEHLDLSLAIPPKKPASIEDCLDLYATGVITTWHCADCSAAAGNASLTQKDTTVNDGQPEQSENKINVEEEYSHPADGQTRRRIYQNSGKLPVLDGNSNQMEQSHYKQKEEQKIYRAATVQCRISKAAPVLTIQLKRFNYSRNDKAYKLEEHVSFQDTLDIKKFMDPGYVENDEYKYCLVAVIVHSGPMLGEGHSFAYVRARNGGQQQESGGAPSWFCASDESITPVSLEQVLKCQAYILFYEKKG